MAIIKERRERWRVEISASKDVAKEGGKRGDENGAHAPRNQSIALFDSRMGGVSIHIRSAAMILTLICTDILPMVSTTM